MSKTPQPEPVETELKLQLDPESIDAFKARAALAGVAATQISINNEYFDTRDRLLLRNKMALRLRRANGQWLQTLKTAGAHAGAMTRRGEWETPAKTSAAGNGQLDVPRLKGSPLPQLLAQRTPRPRLVPQFQTHVQRTLWIIEREQSQIEVALDVGEITAMIEGKPIHEPICGIELELKRGHAAAVIDLALDLMDSAAKTPLRLLPIARSKAERGYQLAKSRAPEAVKASAKGFTEKLTRNMSLARALRAVMAHGIAVVTANCELFLRHDDSEYVHQARVALRRVRSAIRLFDRARRDVPESLTDELRWFARALGIARDWDVFVEQTLPQSAKAAGTDVVTRTLQLRAEQRRRSERDALRAMVQSTRYAALVLQAERWSTSPSPADSELLKDAAQTASRRLAKKMFKPARFFAALTPERRHRVRIAAKRLRYALDLFAIALPKRSTSRYVDALSDLQDILGELNDAAVAQPMLLQLSESARLKRAAHAALKAAEQQHVISAEKSLLALAKLDVSWG